MRQLRLDWRACETRKRTKCGCGALIGGGPGLALTKCGGGALKGGGPGLAPTSQTDTRQRLGGLPARRWELRVICYIANSSPAETRRCLEWRRSLGGPHQVRRRRLDCHQVRRRRFDWRACETRPHIDWWRAIARPLRRIRPVPDEILFVMEIDGPE